MDWNLLFVGLTGGATLGVIFTGGRSVVREHAIRSEAFRDVARGDPHATSMVRLYQIEWEMDQEHQRLRKDLWLARERAAAGKQKSA